MAGMAASRRSSSGQFNWQPKSFQNVIDALRDTRIPMPVFVNAIKTMRVLTCPSPTWDQTGTYQVGLNSNGNPEVRRSVGGTWSSVVEFDATPWATRGPLFSARVGAPTGGLQATGLVTGPGGSIVLVSSSGATPQAAQQLAQQDTDRAVNLLNQGQALNLWLAAIWAQAKAGAASPGTMGHMQTLAGIPNNSAHGQYIQARQSLQQDLGLPLTLSSRSRCRPG